MDAIRERNSDFQTVEPWFDALRCKAEEIVREDRLPVTTAALYRAVEITNSGIRTNTMPLASAT